MDEDAVVIPDTGLEQELRATKALLGEQMRAFSGRTKNKVGLLKDLHDFFTQQAEIEHQYAKSLEQLFTKYSKPRQQRGSIAQLTTATQNAIKKRQGEEVEDFTNQYVLDHEPTGLSSDVWNVLLVQTRKRAESRNRFSQNLSDEMATLLNTLERETSMTAKKCTDLTSSLHGELMATFKKMDDSMKYYHVRKAKAIKSQENFDKAKEKGLLKKGEKLREKAVSHERQAIQSRNEYILSLVTSNAYKRRYYKVEVGNLIDAMDNNFHESLKYIVQVYHDLSKQSDAIADKALTLVHDSANHISPKVDKTRFLEEFSSLFSDNKLFEFLRFRGDVVSDIQIDQETLPEYIRRYQETEQVVLRLDYQIEQERKTLHTISSLRGSVSTALAQTDEGVSKSIENASMYGEAYQRLCLKMCQRACVAAQLEQLGEALGSHRPPRSEFSPSNSLAEINLESIQNLGAGSAGVGEDKSRPPSDDEESLGDRRQSAARGKASPPDSEAEEEEEEEEDASAAQNQAKAGRDRAQSMGDAINAALKSKDEGGKVMRRNNSSSSTAEDAAVGTAGTSALPTSSAASSAGAVVADGPPPMSRSGSTVSSSLRPAPGPPGPAKKPSNPNVSPNTKRKVSAEVSEKERAATAPSSASATITSVAAPAPAVAAAIAAPTSPAKKPDRPPEPAKKAVPSTARKPAPTAPAIKPARPEAPREGSIKRATEVDAAVFKFGVNLQDVLSSTGRDIPLPVESCIRCLEHSGMRDEGLFRVPGSTQQIDDLKTDFERGNDPLASGLPSNIQTEAVAGVLKLYLRQLEDPLMTSKLYKAFVQVGNISNRANRIAAIKEAVSQHMPKAHSTVVSVLFPFLHRVAQLSEFNKMTVSNLALVFGPTLMPAPKGDMGAMLRDATAINTLMSTLIENHEVIFQELSAPAPQEPAAVIQSGPAVPAASAAAATVATVAPATPRTSSGSVSEPDTPAPDMAPPPPPPASHDDHKRARAKFDYSARNDVELSFKKGDVLVIYDQPDKNWWSGKLNGRDGFVAAAYVELIPSGAAAPPVFEEPAKPKAPQLSQRVSSMDIPPPPPEDEEDEPPHMPAPPLPPMNTSIAEESFVSQGAPDEALSQMYGEDLAQFLDDDVPPSPPPEPQSSTPPPPPPPSEGSPMLFRRGPPPASLASPVADSSPPHAGAGARGINRTHSFGPTFAPPPPPPSGSRGRDSMKSMPEEEFLHAPPPSKPSLDDLPPPPPPVDDAEC